MAITQASLFSWDAVEARSDRERFFRVRDPLPDEAIIQALEVQRGQGRDDFPVRAMFNAVLAGIVFQHPSLESLIRAWSRNPALWQACGFRALPVQKKPVAEVGKDERTGRMKVVWSEPEAPTYGVPSRWNVSRFLARLIPLETEKGSVSAMIVTRREPLMAVLPDFGPHRGDDGKALASYRTGQTASTTPPTSDPDAHGGQPETFGGDQRTGTIWKKVKSGFGYGLPVMADTPHEMPVAFHLTPASPSEQVERRARIAEVFQDTPERAPRGADFSADRGLDGGPTQALLWEEYRIRPLIDTREWWREEKPMPDYAPTPPITRPLYPDRADTIVHTENGTVDCLGPATGVPRDRAFQGFAADRHPLKSRGPAAAYGLDGQGQAQGQAAGQVKVGAFGRIVRINLTEQDRRLFTPTPYGGPAWPRGYNRRRALERINHRIDNRFGFENHFIRGQGKMQTRVGLALAVMMAMALGQVKAGRLEPMRSLVQPIRKAA